MARVRNSRRSTDKRSPAGEASGVGTPLREVTDSQNAVNTRPDLRYEANPKHKEPWQRGAKGSLCPQDADGSALLAASETDPEQPGKRYATDGARAYCGHEHLPGRWHGFPIEWRAVPAKIRKAWLTEGRVTKRAVREHW